MTQDEQHLNLLSTFHYVLGGLAGVFGLFPIIYVVMGVFFIVAPEDVWSKGEPPPPLFGWMFVVMGSVAMLIGWTLAGLLIAAGRFLARRRRYTFCFMVAAVACIWVPFGTVLGVFTLVVLSRESVKQLFNGAERQQAELARE